MRRRGARPLVGLVAALAAACAGAAEPPPRLLVRVVAVHPHDPAAFTQGLLWHAGRLYESLGEYGHSAVREVEPETGRVLRESRLEPGEFGEGLARVGGELWQLTWREGVLRRWRLADLAPLGRLAFSGEGWGLAGDGDRLVQSDGTSILTLRSADDFRVLGSLRVERAGVPVHYLNELEWADGSIWANVWMSDEIVRIDPASGRVTATYDAGGLLAAEERARAEVLNGIAWNPERRVFYLTGKRWPRLFEVEMPPPG
jgi:glutaminyl-peptide cyclotransferase